MSSMQSTPLPPTWTVVDEAGPDGGTSSPRSLVDGGCSDGHSPSLQYVNRVTGETTSQHPGVKYFAGMIQRARMSEGNKDSRRDVNNKEEVVNGPGREEGVSTVMGDDLR